MRRFSIFYLNLFPTLISVSEKIYSDLIEEIVIDPAVKYNSTQLIESNGYIAEVHHVTTPDGFILELHRIPAKNFNDNKCTVLLQHGLLEDSSNWITNIKNQSLAFLLADQNCDVWLGNSRNPGKFNRN